MARKKSENKNEKERQSKKLFVFLTTGIYKCSMKNIHIFLPFSSLIYMLPKRNIKRYKIKYLGWLQGETRKLHKIFEDKNLTKSVHKKISRTMRNLAWCAKSFVASSGFTWCAKFRIAMRKCWLLDFFL